MSRQFWDDSTAKEETEDEKKEAMEEARFLLRVLGDEGVEACTRLLGSKALLAEEIDKKKKDEKAERDKKMKDERTEKGDG